MGTLPRTSLLCGLLVAFAAGGDPAYRMFTRLNWIGGESDNLVAGEGVLVARDQFVGHSGPPAIYRSLDTGKTWQPFLPRTEDSIAFGPLTLRYDPIGRLFYAFTVSGAYVAAPTAAHWTRLFRGRIWRISVGGKTMASIYWPSEGVNVSQDSGKTWTSFKAEPMWEPSTLGGVLAAGSCAYAGYGNTPVLVSCDGGETWRRSGSGALSNNPRSMVVSPDGAVLALTDTGIVSTADSGKTWVPWTGNPAGKGITSLDRREGSLLAWGDTTNTAFRTTDGGRTWTSFALPMGIEAGVDPYALLSEIGSTLLYSSSQGLKTSTDGGRTWEFANTRALRDPILSLAARGRRFLALAEQGIFVSGDSALTWDRALPAGNGTVWTALAGSGSGSASNSLFAAGSRDGKVRFSTDTGITWSRPFPLPAPDSVTGLAVFGGSIVAATAHGIRRLSPRDGLWSDVPLPGADTGRVLVSGADVLLVAGASHLWEMRPDGAYADRSAGIAAREVQRIWNLDKRLFAFTSDGSLHQWSDTAASWRPTGYFGEPVLSLAGSGDFLVALIKWGAFFSEDGGWTWSRLVGASVDLRDLAYSDGTIYAGDSRGGVWMMRPAASGNPVRTREAGRTRIRRDRPSPGGLWEQDRRLDGRKTRR